MDPIEASISAAIARIGQWHAVTEGIAALQVGDAAPWFVELRRGQAPRLSRDVASAQCTLKLSAETWAALAGGALSPNAALLQQKLQVEGDVSLAQSFARAALG